MGTYNEKEDFYYCNECGAINKKSAVICCECNGKIKKRHFPFADFLKKHIKSEIGDKIAGSLFALIRKFIVSHLYGTVLTISLIATVAVSAIASTPYIKKVDSAPVDVKVDLPEDLPEPHVHNVTEDDQYTIAYLTTNYDSFAESLRGDENYYGGDNYVSSVQELRANGNIPGYNYNGVFEMFSNPVNVTNGEFELRRPIPSTATGNVTTELGKTLQNAGYTVMECDYYMGVFDHYFEGDYDNPSLWTSNSPTRLLVYRFVMVRTEDSDWYVAEERLVKSIG